MANKKISELVAVSAAALTDEYEVNQSGTSKKVTLTQIQATLDDQNWTWTGSHTFSSQVAVTVSGATALSIQSTDSSSAEGPFLDIYRNSSSVAQFDGLGAVRFYGNNDAAEAVEVSRLANLWLNESDGAETNLLRVYNVSAGGSAERLRISEGLWHASVTGGNKGDNTINFGAVYDDNTLLTCYVIDAVEGKMRVEDWDARVPDIKEFAPDDVERKTPTRVIPRRHEGARKFSERVGSVYDPLDPDKFWKHYVDKRHLTAFPNPKKFKHSDLSTGHWIQRLIETVEILAYHDKRQRDEIKSLTARVLALESR